MPENMTDYKIFKEIDPVIKAMYENLKRGEQYFDTYVSEYRKNKRAYDRPFDNANFDIGGDRHTPNIIRGTMTRNVVEIFRNSVKEPEFSVDSYTQISEEDVKKKMNEGELLKDGEITEFEKASLARSSLNWLVGQTKLATAQRRGTENWFAYGDVIRQPVVTKTKQGKIKLGVRNNKPDATIMDPDGRLIDSDTLHEDINYVYFLSVLSKASVRSIFGDWVFNYASKGSIFKTPSELLNKGENPQSEYWVLIEGRDKSGEHEVAVLGGNGFPVMRHSPIEASAEAKAIYDKVKDERGVSYMDEYETVNQWGEPDLGMTQFHCFYNSDYPWNWGLVQKLYSIQYGQELVENGKIDALRRQIDNILVVSNSRPNQFNRIRDEYLVDRETSLFSAIILPPSGANTKPEITSLEYPSLNPVTAQAATEDLNDLARNLAGVDPNRLEVQRAEGLGVRELLQEEKTRAVQSIVEDNIGSGYNREYERLLQFMINKEGFGLDDVYIEYDKVMLIDDGNPAGGYFINKTRVSIRKAAEMLKGWNYEIRIGKDTIIDKSKAVILERLLEMLRVLPPDLFPNFYKKLLLSLNEYLDTDITSEDLIQMAPAKAAGGASQFRSGGGAEQNEPGGVGAPAGGGAEIPGANQAFAGQLAQLGAGSLG